MGGFLIPFINEFQYINFNLTGITSISMDTHKYGYSLKGSSILLFNDWKIKKFQHYINQDWNGGIYATPTLMGSKSGGLIASAWSSLLYIGKNNYTKYAMEIQENLILIKTEIKKLDSDINIIGEPKLNIIAFKSTKLDIYQIVNEMKKYKWNLSIMQNPPSFHFCITKLHTKNICKIFIENLKESIKITKKNPSKLSGTLALYGSSSKLKNALFIEEIIHDYIFLLSKNNISHRYLD
jgi:sphinganine-1-phosphate aldolase